MSSAFQKRVFGLDILRATAVMLVLFGHILQQSRPPVWAKHFGSLGILGVEIFFVLSGFLIGSILVGQIQDGGLRDWRTLRQFWFRRWMRTLPLYYLFFFIYLKCDWTGPSRLSDRLDFLVFLQSFAWKGPDFFTLAWSLAIEEYFYLLFPLAWFGPMRWNRNPIQSLKVAIGVFLAGPLFLKMAIAPYAKWDDFDRLLRMVTVTRLDSLMYGVVAAFIKLRHPQLWSSLSRRAAWRLVFPGAVAVYLYLDVPGLLGSFLIQSLIFPAISLSVALTLPFFDGIRTVSGGWARRAITFISTVSYSIYLGHILVLTLINNMLHASESGWTEIYLSPLRLYPLYLIFVVLLTPITYYGWELPWIRWRDSAGIRGPLLLLSKRVS